MIKHYVRLLRPNQWIKNFFVFLPAFFAGEFFELENFLKLSIVFGLFCGLSSAVYIFNDLIDKSADQKHPTKKFRPIASGIVKQNTAIALSLGLILTVFALTYFFAFPVLPIFVIYLTINILYSVYIKRFAVIDITFIAFGFVLRTIAGGFATDIFVSKWILIMAFLLALFIALGKRRADVLIYEKEKNEIRKSINGYNSQFISLAMAVLAGVIIVAYLMYTVSEEVIERVGFKDLYFTGVFVLIGLFRFLQITFVEEKSEDPSKLVVHDPVLIITIFVWIASFFTILYL